MGVKIFKVEKDSHLGALHLVRSAPGHVSPDSPLAPVLLYIDNLRGDGHRVQRVNLERAGTLLGGHGLDYDWYQLRAARVEFLRGALLGFRTGAGQPISAATINQTLAAVRGVARAAWRLRPEWLTAEDLARIKEVPRVRADHRRRTGRALSEEEIASLLQACDRHSGPGGARDAAMVALLFGAGLRRAEAARLSLSDYDQRSHSLYVRGKGGRDRRAHFRDGGARRALHNWLRFRGREPGPLLCPVTRWGEVRVDPEKHLTGEAIYLALARRARDAGLSPFSPHDLRRTFATRLLDEREDLKIVSELMGHVSITTTAIYDHRPEQARAKASLKIRVPFRTGRRKRKKKRRWRR